MKNAHKPTYRQSCCSQGLDQVGSYSEVFVPILFLIVTILLYLLEKGFFEVPHLRTGNKACTGQTLLYFFQLKGRRHQQAAGISSLQRFTAF